jgi:ribosomal protein S18 acetylase RimI-like enzyme
MLKPLKYSISEITLCHKSQWMYLWKCYTTISGKPNPADDEVEAIWQRISNPILSPECLVAATPERKLVGFAHFDSTFKPLQGGSDGYLINLYVHESKREKGIGKSLIEAVKEIGRERQWLHISWKTDPENLTALKFYNNFAERDSMVSYKITL